MKRPTYIYYFQFVYIIRVAKNSIWKMQNLSELGWPVDKSKFLLFLKKF